MSGLLSVACETHAGTSVGHTQQRWYNWLDAKQTLSKFFLDGEKKLSWMERMYLYGPFPRITKSHIITPSYLISARHSNGHKVMSAASLNAH